MANPAIATVIVTYNRKVLLRRCLTAVIRQNYNAERIFIVDNSSTDGTREALSSEKWLARTDMELLALPENVGGAGGFSTGLEHAIDKGAEWIWMMDDDAEPHPNALEELMKVATDPAHIYGSLAVYGNETSWLTTVLEPPLGEVNDIDAMPEIATVQSLPFLGFLIHRSLVERIGLPDAGFFIAADDAEYCIRSKKAGAKIIIASKSRIEHPKSRPYKVKVLGRTLTCLALPPWKRYYDTRNRLLIARKHYGARFFTQTIPGSFIRMLATLITEPRKGAQLWAWFCGMFDGLCGIKGKRHEKWKIKV